MSLYFKGSKEQAIAAFRESLAIQPYWVTYSNLGKVYLAESKPAEAVGVLLPNSTGSTTSPSTIASSGV